MILSVRYLFIHIKAIILSVSLGLYFPASGQVQIRVDFSKTISAPLIKTKFNVYQTPLAPLSRLERDGPLLKEIGIRSLRFESAWGKTVDFNAPSITGTYPEFSYNRVDYTRFIQNVVAQGVYPLLTLGYNPKPLNKGTDPREKPNNMAAWNKVSRDFAGHWKQCNIRPIDYEIWNEPDLHIFFNGSKADYFEMYKAGATGIKDGDANAKIGGPVTAFTGWYRDFLEFVKHNNLPLDFLSGHAYANAPDQLDSMRSALGKYNWPLVETYITEYASYPSVPNTDIAEGGAQERYVAAADFLKDAKMFLNYTELTKVYWAQWLDVELMSKQGKWYYNKGTDKMGLVDLSGKRKALYNGFKIYNMMPVDRNSIVSHSKAVDGMASSDAHNAAAAIWNSSNSDTLITAALSNIPFSKGKVSVYRIDAQHSSYYENNSRDDLEVTETVPLTSNVFNWTGKLPAKGVLFFQLKDNSGLSELKSERVAEDVRTYHWFRDRGNSNYADFDRKTWIARLGMGSDKDTALSQIGVEMINIPAKIRIKTELFGKPYIINNNSLIGYRLDFMDTENNFVKSILYHGKIYKNYCEKLPWGKKDIADSSRSINLKNHLIDIEKSAPHNFNGKLILTFIIQNTGRDTGAKFKVIIKSKSVIPYSSLYN